MFFAILNAVPILKNITPIPIEYKLSLKNYLKPEMIKLGNHKITVGNEYIPEKASIGYLKKSVENWDSENSGVVAWADYGKRFELELALDKPESIELPKWFFPGWKITNEQAELVFEKSQNGLISLNLEKGTHQVTGEISESKNRTILKFLSLFIILCLGVLFVFSIFDRISKVRLNR